MWCIITGEAAGEIWNWSLLGVKGLNISFIYHTCCPIMTGLDSCWANLDRSDVACPQAVRLEWQQRARGTGASQKRRGGGGGEAASFSSSPQYFRVRCFPKRSGEPGGRLGQTPIRAGALHTSHLSDASPISWQSDSVLFAGGRACVFVAESAGQVVRRQQHRRGRQSPPGVHKDQAEQGGRSLRHRYRSVPRENFGSNTGRGSTPRGVRSASCCFTFKHSQT